MIIFQRRQLYIWIFSILFLSACSANRDTMFGADIIEYTIPLTAKAQEKKITKIFSDRGVYKYHGRVKVFADTLRKNGMDF